MLRSIPRALPRVARLNQVRPAALAAYVAQPKAIRAYATEAKAVAPSPNDAFASGANQYYIEE